VSVCECCVWERQKMTVQALHEKVVISSWKIHSFVGVKTCSCLLAFHWLVRECILRWHWSNCGKSGLLDIDSCFVCSAKFVVLFFIFWSMRINYTKFHEFNWFEELSKQPFTDSLNMTSLSVKILTGAARAPAYAFLGAEYQFAGRSAPRPR
jgi:hypothetical protein